MKETPTPVMLKIQEQISVEMQRLKGIWEANRVALKQEIEDLTLDPHLTTIQDTIVPNDTGAVNRWKWPVPWTLRSPYTNPDRRP